MVFLVLSHKSFTCKMVRPSNEPDASFEMQRDNHYENNNYSKKCDVYFLGFPSRRVEFSAGVAYVCRYLESDSSWSIT